MQSTNKQSTTKGNKMTKVFINNKLKYETNRNIQSPYCLEDSVLKMGIILKKGDVVRCEKDNGCINTVRF